MPQNPNNNATWHPPAGRGFSGEEHGVGQGALSPVGRSSRNTSGSSFAARFGRVILSHGIAALPSALYHYQGKLKLSAQQVWFVSYVLSHKWDEDLPYPSLKKMERCTGISERHLRRMKSGLCQKGLLEVYARHGERERRDTDAYDFSGLFARVEKVLVAEPPPTNAIRIEGPVPDQAELGQLDSSFVARYGRVIARHGVTAVPRAIFTHQSILDLTPQQVWFITYIFSFQWDTSLPYPSIRRMATVTGYSSVQLHNIKAELVKAGYLSLVRRRDDLGGQDTNAYDFSGLLEAIRALLQREATDGDLVENLVPGIEPEEEEEPLRRGRKPKRHVENGSAAGVMVPRSPSRGDSYLSAPEDNQFTGVGDIQLLGGTDLQFIGAEDHQLTRGEDVGLSRAGKSTSPGRVTRALPGGRTRSLHEIESIHTEENREDNSNHRSPKKKSITTETDSSNPSYSPYLAAVIADFSTELNDPDHVVSNVTQALRLWQTSGLDEQEFTELLYEAKRNTRLYQGKQGLGTINNKMAYFFVVLRQIIEQEPNE